MSASTTKASKQIDAGLITYIQLTFIQVSASGVVVSHREAFPAGAFVAPRDIHTVLRTATVGIQTFIDVWKICSHNLSFQRAEAFKYSP